MTDKKPSLPDLIAATPGAQSRAQADASIKARRAKLLGAPEAEPPHDFTAAEPLPPVEAPDEFAKGFFARLMEKQSPPRASKPRLVVDNNNHHPSDDDPEPPKAA